MTLRWVQVDEALQHPPSHISPTEDLCYFAREYVSGGGYKASPTNQLISNFKKPVAKRGTREWYYKEQAITQFAQELGSVFPQHCVLGFIPCSKRKDDPEYDDRFELTLQQLKSQRGDLTIVEPLAMRESMEPFHVSGQHRDPEYIYDRLEWKGLREGLDHVILIDDVITSGAHFKACKRLIREHCPEIEVAGVFWARAITATEPQAEA